MKNRIFFILVFVSFYFLSVGHLYASEICSSGGYTVLTINGVFTNLNGALDNRDKLARKFDSTYNNEPITFDYLFNPTHGPVIDLLQATEEKYFDQKSFNVQDSDFAQMLNDTSEKVTTQKILFVAHSQGNFYANTIYDAIADLPGGVPSRSVGVYGVATPASRVAGGGIYLTSDTDKVISGAVSKAPLTNILKPNTHIDFKFTDDLGMGHDFSKIYLAYEGNKIVSDIKSSLDKLQNNDEQYPQDSCISPKDFTLTQNIEKVVLASNDFILDTTKNVTVFVVKSTVNIGIAVVKSVYNVSVAIVNGVHNSALAFGGLLGNVVNSLPNDNNSLAVIPPTTSSLVDEPVVTPGVITPVDVPNQDISLEEQTTPTIDNSLEDQPTISADTPIKEKINPIITDVENIPVVPDIPQGGIGKGGGGVTPDSFNESEIVISPTEENKSSADDSSSGDSTSSAGESTLSTTTISVDTTLPAGEYTYENLVITDNAILTLSGDPDASGPFKGVKINATNITINPGSSISADVQGYNPNKGPGASTVCDDGNHRCVGASYGGLSIEGVNTYGSATKPLDLGSGGIGKGGGAIYLVVSDTFKNNGIISADGDTASSGGSVYIVAKNIDGNGIVRANGGRLNDNGYLVSPGGGGRIALYYQTSLFSGITEAKGGCGSYDGMTSSCGGYGTVGMFDQSKNDLYINNYAWQFLSTDAPFNLNNIYVSSGDVKSDANISINANNLFLNKNSIFSASNNQTLNIPIVTIDGGSTLALSGTQTITTNSLTVTGINSKVVISPKNSFSIQIPNITIDTGAFISADGDKSNVGAGTIKLVTSGVLNNNGIISVNGYISSNGGIINVTANTLSGSGIFQANGGMSSISSASGDGGIIELRYKTSSFSGKTEALGGKGDGSTGKDGTVNIIDESIYTPPVLIKSSSKAIVSFGFLGLVPSVVGVVDDNTYTISLTVPFETDVSSITPSIVISDKASIVPNDGLPENFASPVVYAVIAEDGSSQDYIVTVSVSPDPKIISIPEKLSIISYTFNGKAGDIISNPLTNPISIVLSANKNVNWMSLKIENKDDAGVYKIFQSGSGCVDGTNTCTKIWNGLLSKGGLLQDGTFRLKVHVKDLDNNEFYDYLIPYNIKVDTKI